MFRPCTLVLIFAVIAVATGANADEPFETIEVGARYVANVNENEFHDYWDSGYGAELFVATPLARSHVLAGIRYLYNNAPSDEIPDFQSLFAWAGISMDADVTERLRMSLGTAVGATQWIFDDQETVPGLRNELEMGTEVFVRARVGVIGSWAVTSSLTHQVTYTRERIRLTFVSVGLTRTFDTPGWLRRILE